MQIVIMIAASGDADSGGETIDRIDCIYGGLVEEMVGTA